MRHSHSTSLTKHHLAAAICAAMAAPPAALAAQQPMRSVLALQRSDRVAQLMIYGLIGDFFWEGITAVDMVAAIEALDVDIIRVRINSRGGAVDEGCAIRNALARHPARVQMIVDGAAESIASLVTTAGDDVVMAPNSWMMLHAPYSPYGGNAAQKRREADNLDTIAKAMAENYIEKTGKRAEIEAILADGHDHYFNAAQAIELGLADRIGEDFDSEGEIPEAAAAVALAGYVAAIADTPSEFSVALRGRIQAAATTRVFTSLPEVTQRAVVAHIEDPTMKQKFETILAAAGGNNPAPAATPVAAAPAPTAANPSTADAVAVALGNLRTRNEAILAVAQPHMTVPGVREYVDGVIAAADLNLTPEAVGTRVLALLAAGRVPLAGGGHVVQGADERDKKRIAMASAIEVRAYGGASDGSNPYRGMTMFEMARASAEAAGVNTRGMDRMDVVGAAFTHSSSDFPLLLGDTARKALKRGYEEAPEVFPLFTRAVSLSDFKPTSLAGLGRFSNLDIVREGGEYKYGTFNESGSSLQLVTYGKMFSVTRQAIINDDLNALSDVPRKMGQAAKRTIGNAVFNLITSNPILSDGFALFSTEHGNLVSPGAVISTASIDGMRVLMATQTDADGNIVRVPLKYIIVPMGLGGLARTVLESQFEVGGSKNLTTPNTVRNTFEIIEDPRLDANSATAWYGIADPALFDGLVVGYLDGNQEPYLESKEGWSVDGTAWKVRIDAAAAVADPIALAKNPGA